MNIQQEMKRHWARATAAAGRCGLALLAAGLALSDSSAQAQTSSRAESGDVEIAYEVVGEGEPLVLLPGFSQSRDAWRQAGFVEALLERGRQVILIDPRGHGESGKPLRPIDYRTEVLAADVVAVLDQEEIEAADLLGYSRGGAIAIATAALQPERVRSIVAGGAHPYAEDMSPFREAIDGGIEEWIGLIEANVGSLPEEARQMFLANDANALGAAVANDRPDLSSELRRSGVPILLYAGSEDPRAPLAREFAAASEARYLELPALNHFEAFFATEPLIAAAEAFWAELGEPD